MPLHQYECSEWQAWAVGGRRRLSRADLMSDLPPNPAEERHMYVPMKQATYLSHFPINEDLNDEEMVARVVSFFQSVQTNNAIRQLEREEQGGFTFQWPSFPPLEGASVPTTIETYANTAQHTHAGVAASAAGAPIVDDPFCLTELQETPSFMAEQAAIWDRLKNPPKSSYANNNNNDSKKEASVIPIIPEWMHAAAHQEGRKIRVVTVNKSTETRTVTCIGCQKDMLAATNVQLVFCPCCGTTFAPDTVMS